MKKRRIRKEKPKSKTNSNEKVRDSLASEFDPSGSYTGVPLDTKEKPTQDADDL